MRYPALLAAAAVLGAAFAIPAAAESVAVKYSDLDLSTSAGQAQLERRINNAARSICGSDSANTGTRLRSDDARQCLENAKARVHEQVAEAISRDSGRG
jgi:UrcA family protein